MAEDFDAMEVCCETVVAYVEPEICDCLFSGFIFVVLMFCLHGKNNKKKPRKQAVANFRQLLVFWVYFCCFRYFSWHIYFL